MRWTVLRFMRWYGVATCAKTGWGTRQNGAEVSLGDSPAVAAASEAPLTKLLDPLTETTIEMRIPRRSTV